MCNKTQEWTDRAKEGHPHCRGIWFLMEHPLWTQVGCGVCILSSPWCELDRCLCRQWWQILPMRGLIRSAAHQIRDTNIGLFGADCPHVRIECLIVQMNKLLMHHGCDRSNGLELKVLYELMLVELGLSVQAFQESYGRYESWLNPCWLKSL